MVEMISQKTARLFSLLRRHDLLVLIIVLSLVASAYAFMSVHLHDRFMTFALDTGVFDEWIWKISRGKFPYSGVGCNWILEDHFQLILYLFAPLYWVWDNVRALLIAQSILMVAAAYPLYLLSKKLTQQRGFSFSVVASYLLFLGTQFSILNEFHQITIAPLFLALFYYGLETRSRWLWIISVVGLLITKEDLSLLVASIGLGLMFLKNFRLAGLITALTGAVWFFFLIYVLMPAISFMGMYDHFDFGSAGFTPLDVIHRVLQEPSFFFVSMISPAVKIQTLIRSFLTFALIPLLAPLFLLTPLAEDFVTRFIYAGPQVTKWGLVNHHAAVSSMLLAIATVYGARRLMAWRYLRQTAGWGGVGVLLLATALGVDVWAHGPIHSLVKPQFYVREQWMNDIADVIAHTPEGVSLAAQNSVAPHVTHRDAIYRVPYGLNSDYMIFDLHDGPNKYAPLTYPQATAFVGELLSSQRYSIAYQKGDALLLKRNFKTDITKSPYYNDTRFCYYSWEDQ